MLREITTLVSRDLILRKCLSCRERCNFHIVVIMVQQVKLQFKVVCETLVNDFSLNLKHPFPGTRGATAYEMSSRIGCCEPCRACSQGWNSISFSRYHCSFRPRSSLSHPLRLNFKFNFFFDNMLEEGL